MILHFINYNEAIMIYYVFLQNWYGSLIFLLPMYSVPSARICIFNEDRLQSMNTLTTHRMSQDQFRNYREFSRPLHSNTIPKISDHKETKSLLERHTWQEDLSTSCPFFVKYWLHSYASISSNAYVKEELDLYYIIK